MRPTLLIQPDFGGPVMAGGYAGLVRRSNLTQVKAKVIIAYILSSLILLPE